MQNAQAIQPIVVPLHRADPELASMAAAGDEASFEGIMRRHNQLLFRTARGILKSDADAEDALQEAYLSAWRALGTFRAEAKLSTWLVRIVINEALGRLRRPSAQVIPLDIDLEGSELQAERWMEDDPSQDPERAAQRAEMRRLMEERIDKLPDVFRTVFILRAVEELSVEEVSQALQIPPATVRTRLFRARSLLRDSLSRDVDMAIGDAFAFAGVRCDRIVASVLARIANTNQQRL